MFQLSKAGASDQRISALTSSACPAFTRTSGGMSNACRIDGIPLRLAVSYCVRYFAVIVGRAHDRCWINPGADLLLAIIGVG